MDLTRKQRVNLWVKTRKQTGLTIKEFTKKYGIPGTVVLNWHKSGVTKKYILKMLLVYKEVFGKEFPMEETKVAATPPMQAVQPSSPAMANGLAYALKKEDGKILRNVIAFIKDRCEMKISGQEYFALSHAFERHLKVSELIEKYIE